MKIHVILKDPDGFQAGVEESVLRELKKLGLRGEERENAAEEQIAAAWKHLERWVEFEDYVALEFDTVTRTATVLPRRRKARRARRSRPSRRVRAR